MRGHELPAISACIVAEQVNLSQVGTLRRGNRQRYCRSRALAVDLVQRAEKSQRGWQRRARSLQPGAIFGIGRGLPIEDFRLNRLEPHAEAAAHSGGVYRD